MTSDGARFDRHFLESRVARRMFAVVAVCALMPVATFAWVAYGAVRKQLEDDAAMLLRRETKEAGMAVIERLLLADEALRLRIAAFDRRQDLGAERATATDAVSSLQPLAPDDPQLAQLSPRERAHLARGNTLLVLESGGPEPSLRMLRRDGARPGGPGAWRATLDPAYVFTPTRREETDRYWVTDPKGVPLYWSTEKPLGPGESTARRMDAAVLVQTVPIDGEPWLNARWPIFLEGTFGAASWNISMARPLRTIHRPLHEFEALFPWVVAVTLCGAFGLSFAQVRRSLIPIAALAAGARKIAGGDLSARVHIAGRDEFGELAATFNEMAEVIGRHVDVLSTVNEIGASLSAESEESRLLGMIVKGSMQVTGADGGALFQVGEDGGLRQAELRIDLPSSDAHGTARTTLPLGAAQRCVEARQTVCIDDVQQLPPKDRADWEELDRCLETPVRAYLAVPIQSETGEIHGVLMLIRCGDDPFSPANASLAESLASQAAVSIRKNFLVDSFRSLFEGLIELTVKAIDEKSPYTGDHCRRVPIITDLLMEAACATTLGPLKDFDLSPEEKYELRVAALLHDCGKVVTPVHVMDKATKLEKIFDRIELVASRFEVLKRDAKIRALSRLLGPAEARSLLENDADLAHDLAVLDEDLAFLRECNVGSERMDEADARRVEQIARGYPWQPEGERDGSPLDPDEVTNLKIVRGTLNDDEREVINQHVVTTINLLEELPFPKDMQNVPAIAGAHHERMDGAGYPLGLHGWQLSVQARILGLADVFEALTSETRPYKPARSLGETLEIIQAMCDAGHIDRDLFELMVDTKLHLRYAIDHLRPEQVDAYFQEEIQELTAPWGNA